MFLIYLWGKVEILYIIQYVLYILPRKIGFNSKAINAVHCKCTLCKIYIMCNKNASNIETKV